MRIKEIKILTFEELSPERQKKELDNHRDINVNYDDWCDYILEEFCDDMEAKGFLTTRKDIAYDMFSQGSGASFTAKVDGLKYIDLLDPNGTTYPRLRERYKQGGFDIQIVRTSSNYCHHYTMDVRTIDHWEEEKDDDDVGKLIEDTAEGGEYVDKLAELSGHILEDARRYAQDLHKKLENAYYANTTDEAVKETIICNEMEFEE